MKGFLTILLFAITFFASAQKSVISGVVVDNNTGEPLPFTHVFLSGTTLVGVTDANGQYFLRDVAYGSYQLIASFVGYHQYTYNLSVNKPDIKLGLRLIPLVQDLDNVVVAEREDKEWNRNLKSFKKSFLGQTQSARACEIGNPWVIDFEKKGNELKARSPEPIEVINRALGYKLHFYLQQFVASPTEYTIVGPVRFAPLTDDANQATWDNNRLKTYLGSQKHFLKSLYTRESDKEGFKFYVPVSALAADERSPSFERDKGTRIKVAKPEEIIHDLPNGVKGLVANIPVEVHFESGQDYEPAYKDVLHQVSWIQSHTGFVRFDAAGNVLNPQDVVVVGYWNRLRVAEMLPLDYQPKGAVGTEPVEPEKLQIITDRDWYRPGEVVWYSVMVSGQSSQVVGLGVHVGLTDSVNNTLARRLDPLEGRRTGGQFRLPEQSGTYFLTAFTASSYRKGEAFVKPVMVVPRGMAVADLPAIDSVGDFTTQVTSEADSAGARIELAVHDADRDMLNGNFVVAVSGYFNQCECLNERSVKFAATPDLKIDEGISKGMVVNKKRKPMPGKLMFFTDNLSFSIEKNVGSDGRFELSDVVSYDSTNWLVQFMDAKNRPVSDFEIIWDKSSEPVPLPKVAWKVDCRLKPSGPDKTLSVADLQAMGVKGADSVKMLSEVTVNARRVRETEKPTVRTYGQPQYVVKATDMAKNPAGVNLFNALNGRFPGLRMNELVNSWDGNRSTVQVRGNSSLAQTDSKAPLIIVDGITYTNMRVGIDLLQTIQLTDVDRVEVRTGITPLQGFNGSGGIIAVYTKRTGEYLNGANAQGAMGDPFVKTVRLQGYSTPGTFSADDISFNTLHWDHQALFANDEPYRIDAIAEFPEEVYVTIAGFTPAGDVIRFRQRVKVK